MKVSVSDALQDKARRPPRILIVRAGAMGDVLHALPAVASLRSAFPEAYVGWAIKPQWAPLLRADGATARDTDRMPLVDTVHLVEAKQWNQRPFSPWTMRSILTLWRELRAEDYDIAIDLQGTLRSAVIARLSGAPGVTGSAAPRESVARALYRTPVTLRSPHVTDQAMELIESALRAAWLQEPATAVGTEEESSAGTGDARLLHGGGTAALPLLPRDAEAEAWWQQGRLTNYSGPEPVLLAATAGWGAKEWPPAKFAELALRIAAAGHTVLFNAPPGKIDAVTLETVLLTRDRDRALSRQVLTLPATLPQLIAATRGMRAVIAGDTGPLHLAAALGVPTIGLFGPTAPERTGPRGRHAINLRHASSVTDHHRYRQTEAGLARLSMDEVFAAFQRVIETGQDRAQ